jgi:hypothetical protein
MLDIDFRLFTPEQEIALFGKRIHTHSETTNNEMKPLMICKTRTATETTTEGSADRNASANSTSTFVTACESMTSWHTARSELSNRNASLSTLASIEEETQADFFHLCDFIVDVSSLCEAELDVSLAGHSVHEDLHNGPKHQVIFSGVDFHHEAATPQTASIKSEVENEENLDFVRRELVGYCTPLSVIYEESTILSTEMVENDTTPEAEAVVSNNSKEMNLNDLVTLLAKIYDKTPQVEAFHSATNTLARAEDENAELSKVHSEEATFSGSPEAPTAKLLDFEDLSSSTENAEISFSVGDELEDYTASASNDHDDAANHAEQRITANNGEDNLSSYHDEYSEEEPET